MNKAFNLIKTLLQDLLFVIAVFAVAFGLITFCRPAMAVEPCDTQEYRCHYHHQGFTDSQIADMEQIAAKEYEQRKGQK